MKVTISAGAGRKIIFEDYEGGDNLVKVSVHDGKDIFVIGTVESKELRRLGKAFWGIVMLEEVKETISKYDFYSFENNLIQNKKYIKETESPRLILFRWRFRVCTSCSNDFDIENEGMFYKCGECLWSH